MDKSNNKERIISNLAIDPKCHGEFQGHIIFYYYFIFTTQVIISHVLYLLQIVILNI